MIEKELGHANVMNRTNWLVARDNLIVNSIGFSITDKNYFFRDITSDAPASNIATLETLKGLPHAEPNVELFPSY